MQRFFRSGHLSIIMSLVLVWAQLMYITQASAAPRSTSAAVSLNPELDYLRSEHGRLIEALWDYSSPAVLQLIPENDYEFQVLVWADDPLVGESTVVGVGEFELFTEHEFDYQLDVFPNAGGYTIQLEREFIAAAGELRNAAGETAALVGMLQFIRVEVPGSDYEPVVFNSCIIGEERPNVDDAVQVVDDAMEHSEEQDSKDKGGFQIGCMSPDWIGDNGIQCCMVANAYRSQVKACYFRWLAAVHGCVITAGSVAGGGLVFCLRDLKVPLPALVKLCCLLFIAGSIVGLVLCIGAATSLRQACEAAARAAYCRELLESGCGNPPEGEPPCYGGF